MSLQHSVDQRNESDIARAVEALAKAAQASQVVLTNLAMTDPVCGGSIAAALEDIGNRYIDMADAIVAAILRSHPEGG